MKKIFSILLILIMCVIVTGCNKYKTNENKTTNVEIDNSTKAELRKINDVLIDYFSNSDNLKKINLSHFYIDEQNGIVVVGLFNNDEKQQEEFKNLFKDSIDFKYVIFEEGTELVLNKNE